MLKQFLTDYFSYSVKERRAVIFLVLIILTLIIIPAFFPVFIGNASDSFIDSVRTEIVNHVGNEKANDENSMLNPDYVEAPEENKATVPVPKKTLPTETSKIPVQTDIGSIDINTAGIDELLKIPGLDDRIAKRIITFRDKLGGFFSVEQMKETYGLDSTVFADIRSHLHTGTGVFRKININTAGFDELRLHPYIRYQLANAILEEREKNGDFQSTEAIQKIQLVTPEIYSKLAPYLKTH